MEKVEVGLEVPTDSSPKETFMPFVNIRILAGHSRERKDEIAKRITDAISEVAELPKDA